MRINILETEHDETFLREVLREAAVLEDADRGYTLEEKGSRFLFRRIGSDTESLFTARLRDGTVWVPDAGLTLVGCALAGARINFDHSERSFRDERSVSTAFARAS